MPGGICHPLLSSWNTFVLDVGVAVEIEVLQIFATKPIHKSSYVKARDVVSKYPREDLVGVVILVVVVPKVVADLVPKNSS